MPEGAMNEAETKAGPKGAGRRAGGKAGGAGAGGGKTGGARAGGAKAAGAKAGGAKAAGAKAGGGLDPVLVRMLARAMWRANANLPEDASAEARTAAWEGAREGALQTARAVLRQLQARGVTMTAPANAAEPAGAD
jgi:hypothetical protein